MWVFWWSVGSFCTDTCRVCNISSFELVDDVVDFLHGERCPRVLWLVVVARVERHVNPVGLLPHRGGVQPLVTLRGQIRNAVPVVLVGAGFILHVRSKDFLTFVFCWKSCF